MFWICFVFFVAFVLVWLRAFVSRYRSLWVTVIARRYIFSKTKVSILRTLTMWAKVLRNNFQKLKTCSTTPIITDWGESSMESSLWNDVCEILYAQMISILSMRDNPQRHPREMILARWSIIDRPCQMIHDKSSIGDQLEIIWAEMICEKRLSAIEIISARSP